MPEHLYLVSVEAADADQSRRVLAERIGHDEDLSDAGVGDYEIGAVVPSSAIESLARVIAEAAGEVDHHCLAAVPVGARGTFTTPGPRSTELDAVRSSPRHWHSVNGNNLHPKEGWVFRHAGRRPTSRVLAEAILAHLDDPDG